MEGVPPGVELGRVSDALRDELAAAAAAAAAAAMDAWWEAIDGEWPAWLCGAAGGPRGGRPGCGNGGNPPPAAIKLRAYVKVIHFRFNAIEDIDSLST